MMKRIEKPWGYEIIWAESCKDNGYIGKLLHIKSGHRLSKQYHEVKEETILVNSGTLYLSTSGTNEIPEEEKTIKLLPGNTFHIKPGFIHRFIANESSVELIEVSTKELNDVIRIEDDYNRN